MGEIELTFNVAAARCFWKEKVEQQSVAVAGLAERTLSILDVARLRALRQTRVALWDPTQADDRFSAIGNPVVGVTWWEAVAFCAWWTDKKLEAGDFPSGAVAALLRDYEWEALRRKFYEGPSFLDGPQVPPGRYPVHLRRPLTATRGGRVNNVMRPLHVGLAPVPNGDGPYDMVGNVWEWTRSRVFGRIVTASHAAGRFGATEWDDVDAEAEQTPDNPWRDVVDEAGDLSYRAVRGGSFFSVDEQAAWHPAYRLCDPPFSSYMDLGFRFAVYAESGR
jgi:formylglycine-generating enzyme required for sulfatase activity